MGTKVVVDCSTGAVTQVPQTSAELAQAQADAQASAATEAALAVLTSNGATLRQRAQAALAANGTFRSTVAARATNIANGKTTAQTMSTASVTSISQAANWIHTAGTLLVQVATALDDLNTQADRLTAENSAVIRLLLGQLDTTAGT